MRAENRVSVCVCVRVCVYQCSRLWEHPGRNLKATVVVDWSTVLLFLGTTPSYMYTHSVYTYNAGGPCPLYIKTLSLFHLLC